ncbi:hypothetical protein JOB18_017165 [Solea senegalensis]|uniref:Uncharacterized protein n=1 Tax=Solea senegalensis TaxID=28829 RepID=A0AAV6SFZ1_SOLSE|nr:hypothetical protein JOB18_017165 [Solea senegalensis]
MFPVTTHTKEAKLHSAGLQPNQTNKPIIQPLIPPHSLIVLLLAGKQTVRLHGRHKKDSPRFSIHSDNKDRRHKARDLFKLNVSCPQSGYFSTLSSHDTG